MSRSTSGSRRSGLSRGGEVWPAGERGGRDLGGAGAARGPEVGPGDPRDEQREKRAIRTPRVHGPSLPPVASARLPGLQAAASRKFSSFGAGPGPPGNPSNVSVRKLGRREPSGYQPRLLRPLLSSRNPVGVGCRCRRAEPRLRSPAGRVRIPVSSLPCFGSQGR